MNLPNHIQFQDSGFNIRFIDLRERRSQNIQVNIYNPDNSGHSVLSLIPTTSATTTNLDQFRLSIADSVLPELILKAATHFARLNEDPVVTSEE